MKYQDIARMLGLPCATPEEGVKSFAQACYDLAIRVGIKMSFKEQGIDEKNGWTLVAKSRYSPLKTNVRQPTHVYL